MSLLILKIFKSQNKKIYNSFQEISESMNLLLNDTLLWSNETIGDERNRICSDLVRLNNENKSKLHQVALHLGESYITPFDREDVFEIIKSVNEISKTLVAFVKRSNQYVRSTDFVIDFQIVIELIIKSLMEISNTLLNLQKFKQNSKIFVDSIEKLNSINAEFKSQLENVITEMFLSCKDEKMLVIKQDLLMILEKLNIRCVKHINALESIVVKYS